MANPLRPLLLLICLLAGLAVHAKPVELDHIVAVVNEDVITRLQLNQKMVELAAQLQQKGTQLPPREIFQQQVLNRMIDTRLQLQAARRIGLKVDDAVLAKTIGNIARRNKITLVQLRQALERDGIDFNQFREQLRQEILITRLRQKEVINRIAITDQEVKSYLRRAAGNRSRRSALKLRHILVATPEGASPEQVQAAKKKAWKLVEKLRGGADFAAVAVSESDGRQALEGGELGWIEAARIPSIFVGVVDALEVGEISDPIRNASGFHIVQLEAVKGEKRNIITQTHARHILISTNEIVSDSEAKQRLETLRERIIGGESFATLARSHSDDKGSAIKGGDLGWTSPGAMVNQFERQMDALPINGISHPFQTQFGWHIVQVLGRRDHDNTEEVRRDNARKALRKQKSDEAIDIWLRRLRDAAYIELRLKDEPA